MLLAIPSTDTQRKDVQHGYPPMAKNMNQIDYILIQNKSRQMVKNSRAYHSAEKGSDHFSVLANLQLKLKKPRPAKAVPRRYDVEKLTGRNDLVNDTFFWRIVYK